MKKCPTCDKTFEDSMRFCQVDGTPLVDDAPAFDPYATIVNPVVSVSEAPAEEPLADAAPAEPEAPAADVPTDDPTMHQTVGSVPIAPPEDVLDLPSNDPLKTMYVSETEMQEALGGTGEPDIVELPPLEDAPAPEPPSFIAPEVPAPSFGDVTPPPSPFSSSEPAVEEQLPMPEPDLEPEPAAPAFDEAATMIQPSFEAPPAPSFEPTPSPFEPATPSAFEPPPPAPVAEWTPPPAPDASWQNQEIGSNTPFQPPPPGVEGQNKTLAIISLVCGILSCLCCFSVITGPAGVIMGFMARKKVDEDPAQYGGRGLATGGMITGAIGFVIGVAVIILQIFFGLLSNLN